MGHGSSGEVGNRRKRRQRPGNREHPDRQRLQAFPPFSTDHRDYRWLLAEPGAAHRRGAGRSRRSYSPGLCENLANTPTAERTIRPSRYSGGRVFPAQRDLRRGATRHNQRGAAWR